MTLGVIKAGVKRKNKVNAAVNRASVKSSDKVSYNVSVEIKGNQQK